MRNGAFLKRLISLVLLTAVLFSVWSYPALSGAEGDQYGRLAYDRVYFRKTNTTGAGQPYWCFLDTGWVVRILGSSYNNYGSWYEVECTIPDDLTTAYTGYIMQRYVKVMNESETAAWLKNPVQPGTGVPTVTAVPAADAPAVTDPPAVTEAPAGTGEGDGTFSSGNAAFINTDKVFFRKEASYTSGYWAILPYGWTLYCMDHVTNAAGSWYAVEGSIPSDTATVYTGYIAAAYLTLEDSAPVTDAPSSPVPETPEAYTTDAPSADASVRYVTVNNTFFQTEANYPSDTIALLPSGWPVTAGEPMLSDGAVWYSVSCAIPKDPEGIYYGYIESKFLSSAATSAPTETPAAVTPSPTPEAAASVTPAPTAVPAESTSNAYINTDKVFFRMKPSYSADYLAILPFKWKLTVDGSTKVGNTTWYHVTAYLPDNTEVLREGYIVSSFVTLTGPVGTATPTAQAPTAVPEGTMTPAPTYTPAPASTEDMTLSPYAVVIVDGTNVRQGINVMSGTVTALMAGQIVTILDSSSALYLISTGTVQGYVLPTNLWQLTWPEYNELIHPATATPSPTPTPTPTPSPSPTPTPTPSGSSWTGDPTAAPTGNPYTALGYVRITRSTVNLRATPGGDSLTPNDEDRIPLSTYLRYYSQPIYHKDYYWLYVEYNGMLGYVRSDCYEFVSETPIPIATPYEIIPSDGSGALGTVVVTQEEVNFRSSPNGKVIGTIHIYTRLYYYKEPVSKAGFDWLYVYYNGTYGYIRSDCYGSLTPGVYTPTPTPSTLAMLGYVAQNGDFLSIYRNPGGSVLTTLTTYSILPYYETVSYQGVLWYKVYSYTVQRYGYVSSDAVHTFDLYNVETPTPAPGTITTPTPATFVTVTPSPTPTPTPRPFETGYVITTAKSVYIRSEASSFSTAIGQVPLINTVLVTTDQPVVKNGITWYPVKYNGLYGYMHGNYCTLLSDWQVAVYKATGVVPTVSPAPTAVPSNTTAAPTASAVTPVPSASYLVITTDKVFVRTGPSTRNTVVGGSLQVNSGEIYAYDSTAKDELGLNITWYHIQYAPNVYGYVHGNFVKPITNEEYQAYISIHPTASPTPTVTVPDTYRLLSLNSTGTDVTAVQQVLANLGYLSQDEVTGTFLASTQSAVIQYQYDQSLSVTGIVNQETWNRLFNAGGTPGANNAGSSVSVTLNPVELADWYKGDIQTVWAVGVTAVITDVYTGISFQAKRWAGGSHADVEPLTAADTKAMCAIYEVEYAYEIDTLQQQIESWRRRPVWVTIGNRTFAASMYGIPHNEDDGNTIEDNNYPGQFCVHFVNSTTHTSTVPDTANSNNDYFGHQEAVKYAYDHSISGTK